MGLWGMFGIQTIIEIMAICIGSYFRLLLICHFCATGSSNSDQELCMLRLMLSDQKNLLNKIKRQFLTINKQEKK